VLVQDNYLILELPKCLVLQCFLSGKWCWSLEELLVHARSHSSAGSGGQRSHGYVGSTGSMTEGEQLQYLSISEGMWLHQRNMLWSFSLTHVPLRECYC